MKGYFGGLMRMTGQVFHSSPKVPDPTAPAHPAAVGTTSPIHVEEMVPTPHMPPETTSRGVSLHSQNAAHPLEEPMGPGAKTGNDVLEQTTLPAPNAGSLSPSPPRLHHHEGGR